MHDFFVQYLEDVLFEIMIYFNDAIIDSDWTRFEKEIGERNDTLEQRTQLAELIVDRLAGPGNVAELGSFMRKRTGINVMPDEDEKRYCLAIAALRNLIIHNDGNPNNRFMRRISGLGFKLEVRPDGRVHIDEKWLTQNATLIDRIIFRYDAMVVTQLGIASRDRRGLFWIRSVGD